ncbi:DUF1700 domain-containing protein [Paenibacillus sp. IHBB 10380]|uniref:DUF1700 domain-containing protein n=1 Tax=Paenibacillus sp. IHBB 10380 TaxID=1566358 RepID=UPI0005CFA263|nr:DUF1700 domain-containing protein [Paenibacillus sp. IHBB 10380]AJS57352.1 hypothetical protein UB51_01270 [Paenibacillus sp. IHBB 10380]
MSKEMYLTELFQYLKPLPPDEREEIMADYGEHFEQAELKGRSEKEIISRLGNPRLVAREVLAQTEIQKAGRSPSLPTVTKAVMATVSLGLFNLIIVLLPFVASLLLFAGVYGFAFFLIISPILLFIQHQLVSIFINDFFLMLGFVGLGLLLLIGAMKCTGVYYKLVIHYLQHNLRVIGRI